MPLISPEEQKNIIAALAERGVNKPCPQCDNTQRTLIDEYTFVNLQDRPGLIYTTNTIPAVAIVCTRCGFLATHALTVLGLVPTYLTQDREAENAR